LSCQREVLTSTSEDTSATPVEERRAGMLPASSTARKQHRRAADPPRLCARATRSALGRASGCRVFWEATRKQPWPAPCGARCSELPGEARLARRQAARVRVSSPRGAGAERWLGASRPASRGTVQVAILCTAWWASFPSCRASWVVLRQADGLQPGHRRWTRRVEKHYLPRSAAISARTRGAMDGRIADKLDPSPARFADLEKPRGTKIRSGRGVGAGR